MKLSEIIKTYRKANKLSMDAFSKKAGVSKAYIGFIEGGVNPATNKPITPSIEMVVKLANALDMTTDELINALDDDIKIDIPANRNLTVTDSHEISVLENYRKAPATTQAAIDLLLGIKDD